MTVPGYATDALVDADWAQAHLDDPAVRFVEVDVDTTAYDQSHLPGAVGWNWTSQLADGIRRDIAGREEFGALLRAAASGRTPRSSSTATTTTGSRRGPTGSSSCSATATSGSSMAAASSGSTTACRSRPMSRPRRRPSYELPEPDFALRAFRDDILPRLGDARPCPRRRPLPGRVQRRDHRPARA